MNLHKKIPPKTDWDHEQEFPVYRDKDEYVFEQKSNVTMAEIIFIGVLGVLSVWGGICAAIMLFQFLQS